MTRTVELADGTVVDVVQDEEYWVHAGNRHTGFEADFTGRVDLDYFRGDRLFFIIDGGYIVMDPSDMTTLMTTSDLVASVRHG